MKVLVPSATIEELAAEAGSAVPRAKLIPYDENGTRPDSLDEVEGILRSFGNRQWPLWLDEGPRIRWMHTVSAGVDGLLTPEVLSKPGLVLTDSGTAFTSVIPEFVLAWILLVARQLPQIIDNQRQHRWQKVEQTELSGKTIGIIGLGPIGLGVASRAKAFGTRTIGLRRHDRPAEHVDEIVTGPAGLDFLVRSSDYIVIAAALTQETRHIIGAAELAKMKPTAWIVNIARGGHIDETALIDALTSGAIGGACLDVFVTEPLPANSRLWDLPNVYIAPHNSNGGGSSGVRALQRSIFIENLRLFTDGKPLKNVVDFNLGY